MPMDSVKSTLESLGFIVVEQVDSNEQEAGTVLFIEYGGTVIYPGDSIMEGTTITMHVSSGSVDVGDDGIVEE